MAKSMAHRLQTGQAKIRKVLREYERGELHSGSSEGPRVKSRKQAIAIALSEARRNRRSP